MHRVAFVFSGQGAQYTGMGKELNELNDAAKAVFERADALRPGTSDQCFYSCKEELSLTINTQPCLFCVDLAAAYALCDLGVFPQALAGFLGEIAALTFANTFDFSSGFRLVCRRAAYMQEASSHKESTMVAVLKLTGEETEALCRRFEGAYPVNYNAPGQTVVAMSEAIKEIFVKAVDDAGGKAMPLSVSGAFHSPFMDMAKNKLASDLSSLCLRKPSLPVYSNRTAVPYGNTSSSISENIACQVNRPVLWQKTIENMVSDGIDTFIEVGPGKALCNMIKKITPESRVLNAEDAESLAEAAFVAGWVPIRTSA